MFYQDSDTDDPDTIDPTKGSKTSPDDAASDQLPGRQTENSTAAEETVVQDSLASQRVSDQADMALISGSQASSKPATGSTVSLHVVPQTEQQCEDEPNSQLKVEITCRAIGKDPSRRVSRVPPDRVGHCNSYSQCQN